MTFRIFIWQNRHVFKISHPFFLHAVAINTHVLPLINKQGGLELWDDYGYCCGGGKDPCYVCPMGIWNSTLCGPPMPYCNMTQSCTGKLDRSKFVSGLNVTGWKAISTVSEANRLRPRRLCAWPSACSRLCACLIYSNLPLCHDLVFNVSNTELVKNRLLIFKLQWPLYIIRMVSGCEIQKRALSVLSHVIWRKCKWFETIWLIHNSRVRHWYRLGSTQAERYHHLLSTTVD